MSKGRQHLYADMFSNIRPRDSWKSQKHRTISIRKNTICSNHNHSEYYFDQCWRKYLVFCLWLINQIQRNFNKSSNVSRSMSILSPKFVSAPWRTNELLATRTKKDAHTSIDLIHKEVEEFAGQNVFEKGIIQLTPEEFI